MIKIFFYTSGIGLGGVERVLLEILKGIDKEKFDVKLGLQYENENAFEDEIPKEIKYEYMLEKDFINRILEVQKKKKNNIFYKLFYNLLLIKEKKIIKKKFIRFSRDRDIVIDFKSGDFLRLISMLKYKKKVCWFHTSVFEANVYKKNKKKLKKRLKRMDKIVVVCDEMKKQMIVEFPEYEEKITRIYNPFNIEDIERKARDREALNLREKELLEDKYIVAVSRLEEKHKDIATLIEAYAKIKHKVREKLYIVGEGPDREKIESLIEKLELKDRVVLLGFQKNPYIWMKNARLFVHSSKSEGFGLVLVEAMMCNVPVISSDCPVGPKEILEGGKSGELFEIGNSEQLAEKILKVLNNKEVYVTYKTNAWKRKDNFLIDKVKKQVEEFFHELR